MIFLGLAIFALYLIFKCLYIFFPLRKKNHAELPDRVGSYKGFAILVPAYNEEHVIANCVNSLKNLPYPNYRVYVIDDGSTDRTFDVLQQRLSLMPVSLAEDIRISYRPVLSKYRSSRYPNIYVVRKQKGGKADALNAGIACCSQEIVVTLDADCMLKEDALGIMNRAFQNERVVAAGGTVHITQSINTWAKEPLMFKLKSLIRFQVVQYLNAFYLHKFTQSGFKSLVVISGAYGAFKRDLLLTLRGYRRSVGEDMDITLKIHQYIKTHKKRYIMSYVPQSVCYTECPENLKNLTKQRIRWQKAFIDCTVKYGLKMFWRFHLGISLFFIIDYLLLGTLTSFAFVLTSVYVALGNRVSLIFLALFGLDFLLGAAECLISKKVAARYNFTFSKPDNIRLYLFIPVKMMVLRFMNIFFTIGGTVGYIVNRNRWHKAERLGRGFAAGSGLAAGGEEELANIRANNN